MRKAWTGGMLWLAGCAGTPAYTPTTVAVAPAYQDQPVPSITADTITPEFWASVGDSTLTGLIQQATRGNLDLAAADARVRAARANRREAGFDYLPTVTASGSFTSQRIAAGQFPGLTSAVSYDLYDTGLDATWEVDLFGRVRKGFAARTALRDAAAFDRDAVLLNLTAELARNYFELRGLQAQLDVARRNAENQKSTLALTEDRLTAGRGTAFDRERARSQYNTTLALIPTLEAASAGATYRLAVLTGQAPQALGGLLLTSAPLPALPDQLPVGTPAELLRRRPDVRRAERQYAAQQAYVGVAKADYLPRVVLNGRVGLAARELDGLGTDGSTRYSVGPVLSWPALNLGRVKAQVDASHARAEEARAQYNQTVLLALQDAETALANFQQSRVRVGYLGEAAQASDKAAELARIRFDGGIADFLQVLDAERTRLDAERQLEQARTEAATALVAVYRALGGSWLQSESANTAP